MEEETGGPFVQIATFCQTGLVEAGGQLSIIRVIDRLTVGIIQSPMEGIQPPPPLAQLTLVVVLKSGMFEGKGTITIQPQTPNGTSLPKAQFPALFEGKDRGVQIVLPMAIMVPQEGPYWFEVAVNDVLLTKVPLRIIHQPAQQLQMGTAPPQSS